MTRAEYKALKDGERVWFRPPYFAFPMVGVIKTMNANKGIWVNFFGDAQCLFVLKNWRDEKINECVWLCRTQTENIDEK